MQAANVATGMRLVGRCGSLHGVFCHVDESAKVRLLFDALEVVLGDLAA